MKILAFPHYNNPYQELLYSSIRKTKDKISYLNEIFKKGLPLRFVLLFFPIFLFIYRLRRFKIFHLHWQSFNMPNFKQRNWIYKLNFFLSKSYINLIKFFRFKLVWTIHNLFPHEKATSNDLEITRLLCNIADAKIVHSDETIEEMKRLNLNLDNTFVIPHGSYLGVYSNNKKDTKNKFGISDKDFVFLFMGYIREYKGIPELLEAFSQIKDKNVKLLIAGNCGDSKSKKLLDKYSKEDKRIVFKEGFVKDNEIQNYMNASDIVVYPFRKITTSGSVILASSFGKPIIYPNMGGLKELPKNIGFSYMSKDKNGLLTSMKKAINKKNKLNEISKNSFNYAKTLSWKNISKKTINLYKDLIIKN